MKQRWILGLVFGFIFLSISLFMLKITDGGFVDFYKAYYPAGTQVLTDPFSLYFAKGTEICHGFVNIPILAYIFTPFTLFPKKISFILFFVIGLISVVATWYWLIKITKISGWKIIVLTGLFVVNGPLYYSLKLGNSTHFVLLLLVAANYFFLVKRGFWQGVLLAITALIKIPFWMLGLYYVASKRWRVVIGYFAAILAIVGASLALFGIDLHLFWYKECISPFSDKPMGAFNNQSVKGFLARLLLDSQLNNWVVLEVDWKFRLVQALLNITLIASVVYVFWRSRQAAKVEDINLNFSIILCLAIIISPISWTHYYLVLLLVFALYLGNQLAVPQGFSWSILIWFSALLVSLPVINPNEIDTNTIYGILFSRLLISHYFLGGVLLLGTLLSARWKTSEYSRKNLSNTQKTNVK